MPHGRQKAVAAYNSQGNSGSSLPQIDSLRKRLSLVYVLVLLRQITPPSDAAEAGHVRFIDSLIKDNKILLGGPFAPNVAGDVEGAYLLACSSPEEAHDLMCRDPLIESGSHRGEMAEWILVGINPDAINPELAVRPGDIDAPTRDTP